MCLSKIKSHLYWYIMNTVSYFLSYLWPSWLWDPQKENNTLALPEDPPIQMIPFSQREIISQLQPEKHETLIYLNWKHKGLCEIICNCVLASDILNKGKDKEYLKKQISLKRVDEMRDSHILKVFSVFRVIIAYLFSIYPDNLFSYFDQRQLVHVTSVNDNMVRSVNRDLLSQGLEKIEVEKTLKLEVFRKVNAYLIGHSLLIKKMSPNTYIFFDPNSGEHRNLSLTGLSDIIDEQLVMHQGTDLLFMKGSDYKNRLKPLLNA